VQKNIVYTRKTVYNLSVKKNGKKTGKKTKSYFTGKITSLSSAHPIFCCALPPGGAPQKSGGAHQKFAPAVCAPPRLNCATGKQFYK